MDVCRRYQSFVSVWIFVQKTILHKKSRESRTFCAKPVDGIELLVGCIELLVDRVDDGVLGNRAQCGENGEQDADGDGVVLESVPRVLHRSSNELEVGGF